MITEQALMDFGFIKDENNFKLKELLKNNIKLKEVCVDMYPDNPLDGSSSPFMLLLRTSEKNVTVESDGNRIIFKKDDKFNTHFSNVLFSKITECFFKISEACSEFIVNIQNVYYRVTAFK